MVDLKQTITMRLGVTLFLTVLTLVYIFINLCISATN